MEHRVSLFSWLRIQKNTCLFARQVFAFSCPRGGNLPRPLRQSTGLSQAGRDRRHIKFWGVRHGLFDSRTGRRVSRFFLAPDTKKHLPCYKAGVCLSLPAGRESNYFQYDTKSEGSS